MSDFRSNKFDRVVTTVGICFILIIAIYSSIRVVFLESEIRELKSHSSFPIQPVDGTTEFSLLNRVSFYSDINL